MQNITGKATALSVHYNKPRKKGKTAVVGETAIAGEAAALTRELPDYKAMDKRTFHRGGPVPRQLSVLEDHPYYHPCYREMGVRLDGRELKNVVETYDLDEGWVDVRKKNALGKWRMEQGRYIVERLTGEIEPFWQPSLADRVAAKNAAAEEARQARIEAGVNREAAADEKRARKAAKLAQQQANGGIR